MSSSTRYAKKHAKARKRRYLKAQERLERDRRQAQHAAEALQQALDDLGLPEDLVTEIEGRLRSQHKPTVCLDATSLVVYSYGCDDGRIGPTHCALIGGALGDR